ncbi:hypothetical protein JTB14_024349 [Gonioctena quinquepunctata]|nr:hypothetical protein JTB14_024349 [Gonioctena quinquepunctata]
MHLKKLKLKNANLIDKDYSFLKCFTLLQYLDISNKHNASINKFYEVDELFVKSKWKQLKVLKMNNLSLAFFPEGIAWLESLAELHINNNYISWLPDGVEFMINLVILDISHNHIIAIPEKLNKLECLEVLKASNNYIENVPDLTVMPSLKFLDLYDNLLEAISLNHDAIEYIDLENNYFDTKEIKDYSGYEAKREKIRLQEKIHLFRTNGHKLKESESLSSSFDSRKSGFCSEDDYESDMEIQTVLFNTSNIVEEDDWDTPRKKPDKNPDVDSVDEDWEGFEDDEVKKFENVIEKIYIADEDWMFEDAEDTA